LTGWRANLCPPFDSSNVGENQGLYPIHIETGKRVHQLYSELDNRRWQ